MDNEEPAMNPASDYVIVDDGVVCMYSNCRHCQSGPRSKVIISYKAIHSRSVKNNLITTKCFICSNEEILRIRDVTEGD
jgi:hypothetical protein